MFKLRGIRELTRHLLTEGLTPGAASSAVFIGVFVATVPIYGLQSVVAIGLATLLRLNKPLTFAATFVNNPLLQPFLVVGSIELGHLAIHGEWVSLGRSALPPLALRDQIVPWFVGSTILGAVIAALCAGVAYVVVAVASRRSDRAAAGFRSFIRQRSRNLPAYDRRFIAWKVRLDRLFAFLLRERPWTGVIVDMGCGYGEVLALAAYRGRGCVLYGCDLDGRRVEAARRVLSGEEAYLAVDDVRRYQVPPADLILLIDVLQYLEAADQRAVLVRCADALRQGGQLIVRVHDVERGMLARLTTAYDRVILKAGGFDGRPVHLGVDTYHHTLRDAGCSVREHRMRNLLPFVHVVLVATKEQARA